MKLRVVVMNMFTNASPSAVRARLDRVMGAIECKSKMILIALSIGLLGLTTTVSGAEPSLQQQLECFELHLCYPVNYRLPG